MLNDPREYGSKFVADCRCEWTEEQFKKLDELGTKAFLGDERRREKLTTIATSYHFGRRMQKQFGPDAEIRDKLETIKANTEALIDSLEKFPLWPWFGKIGHNDAEAELVSEILATLPTALVALRAKAGLGACDFGTAVAKKGYLKSKQLTSNAQNWTTYNFFGKLFTEMERWEFKVYRTKKQTPATKFVMRYGSLVDPTWKLSLSIYCKAVEAFKKHPERINEIRSLEAKARTR